MTLIEEVNEARLQLAGHSLRLSTTGYEAIS